MLAQPQSGSTVVGILGPTGVGKTAVAVELARLWKTRVISCDSMQIYRGFPVLTNQPSAGERAAAVHELVDFVDPLRGFSAVEYAALARPLIEEDLEAHGRALVVGGTGLYMRAALAPLEVRPRGDQDLRARLEARVGAGEGPALYAELIALDPAVARVIDPRNLRRVVRALEAVLLTQKAWSGRGDLWKPRYYHPTIIVGLVRDRRELYHRITERANRIVHEGGLEEVRRFREVHGREATNPGAPGIRSAIGYREIWRYLEGEHDLEVAVRELAAATRRYVRRQLTWLRKVEGAVIIDIQGREAKDIAREIADLCKTGAGNG